VKRCPKHLIINVVAIVSLVCSFGCKGNQAFDFADSYIEISRFEELGSQIEGDDSFDYRLDSDSPYEQLQAFVHFDSNQTTSIKQIQGNVLREEREINVEDSFEQGGKRSFLLRSDRAIGRPKNENVDDFKFVPVVLSDSQVDIRTLHKIILSLPDEGGILYYIEDQDVLYTFFLTNQGLFRWESPKLPSELAKQVEGFRKAILMEVIKDDDGVARQELGRDLYNGLIPPMVEMHQPYIKDLLIIPCSSLGRLPFTALQDNNGHYLIEKFIVHYYPSIRLLLDSAGHTPVWPSVYSVGNPLINIVGGDLPGAEKEAQMCADSMADSAYIVGAEATETHFWQNASKYSVVHLACHFGLNVNENVLDSSFMLASDDKNDGYLSIREILLRGYTWNLMVLSACETGVPPGHRFVESSSFWGASHYLLGQVTPSLLTTLWEIDNEATIQFMSLFYSQLAIGNEAEILQKVQQDFIKSSDHWSRPYYWAAFSFHGANY
jgi:CHAT domain-containing protein